MTQAQASPPRHRPGPPPTQIRTLHAYVGMFIAPSVIFFASTGLLQIYNLHEARGSYTPPPLVEKLSMIHKDQRIAQRRRRPAEGERPASAKPAKGDADGPPAGEARRMKPATALLKAFFTAVAVGLILSTLLGLWMALRQPLRRRAYLLLLAIGALTPAILAWLSA